MDMKSIGFMFVLYLTRIDISYTDRIISVMEYTCGRTYNIGNDEKIMLSYTNKRFRNQYDDYGSGQSCGVTFVNRNTAMSICIHNPGSLLNALVLCDASFKYYFGYVPNAPMQNGYTCSDFRFRPMCTTKSTVHAEFRNAYIFGYKVDVELYTEESVVTTTRTPTTQTNDDGYGSTRAVAIGATVAGMFLLVILFYSCRLFMRHEAKIQQERARINEDEQCSPSSPPHTGDQLLDQQTCTDEAPPYSVVMQQQELYSVEEDKNLQLCDPVYQVATSTAATPLPIPENRPSYHDQPGTNHTLDEQAGNHITPTAPSLDYPDDPPPPYPGD